MIPEESNDDEFRRSSLDMKISSESSQFFSHLGNAPLIEKSGDFMKYVEKLRLQRNFEETKGINDKSVINPQQLLEQNIEKTKTKIEALGNKEASIKQSTKDKELKKQKVKEMQIENDNLQQNIHSLGETIDYMVKGIEKKKNEIQSTQNSISQTRIESKNLQESINQQMLTAYEKELAMQDIESLKQKKSSYVKSNSDVSKVINENNREIHVSILIIRIHLTL